MRLTRGEYTNAKKASLVRKVVAGAIDFLTPLLVLLTIAGLCFAFVRLLYPALNTRLSGSINFGPWIYLLLPLPALYAAFDLWRTNGYTIGKRLLHIRVVTKTGSSLGFWRALARTVLSYMGMIPVGLSHALTARSGKTTSIHDSLSGTFELKEIVETDLLRSDHGVIQPESTMPGHRPLEVHLESLS